MLARIVEAGMIVHHEILRQELQDHAVFLQLHAHGALHGAIDVLLGDLARTAHIPAAAVVGAAHGEAADARPPRFRRRSAPLFRPATTASRMQSDTAC